MTEEEFRRSLQNSHEKYKRKYETEKRIEEALLDHAAKDVPDDIKYPINLHCSKMPGDPVKDALADIKAGNPMLCETYWGNQHTFYHSIPLPDHKAYYMRKMGEVPFPLPIKYIFSGYMNPPEPCDELPYAEAYNDVIKQYFDSQTQSLG